MNIIVTNDDGIDAPGMAALVGALAPWAQRGGHEIVVVAPAQNYSGMSAAVSDVFGHPEVAYRRARVTSAPDVLAYALDAPPALCAILGALGTFGTRPDLVISGINEGANVGRSILHSGTVGAVLSAAQLGLSGLAVSVQWGEDIHYDTAAAVAVQVLDELVTAPARTVLNLNVPNVRPRDVKGVRRARISMAEVVAAAGPDAGGPALTDEGVLPLAMGTATPMIGDVSGEDSDEDAYLVEAGYAALTPLLGPHENSDPALDTVIHRALEVIGQHLAAERS